MALCRFHNFDCVNYHDGECSASPREFSDCLDLHGIAVQVPNIDVQNNLFHIREALKHLREVNFSGDADQATMTVFKAGLRGIQGARERLEKELSVGVEL